MKKVISTFLVATLGGFIALATFITFNKSEQTQAAATSQIQPVARFANLPPAASNSGSLDFTVAAENSLNAVVHVKTKREVAAPNNPWARYFGYEMQPQIQMGSGSGVIIGNDGYIVTNNHVIEGATEIEISLNSGENFKGTLIGTDPSTDLAVIKIETKKELPSLRFGNSDVVKVGEWVLAVGNPFDLTSTVTAGIVSAKARNINLLQFDPNNEVFPVESFIQTDAAVNPGNSGGALVNVRGELIGINTAIASRTGSYAGYSFAIPSAIVEKITRDIVEFGNAQRAYIGVQINDVNQVLAEELGLNQITGVYVNGLTENGAAELAGVKEGDVIVGVNDINIHSVPELQEQVSKYRPGDDIKLTVLRDGRQRSIPVTLRNLRGNMELKSKEAKDVRRILGAAFESPSTAELQALRIKGGAKIVELGSGRLANAGVKKGFIITSIDEQPIQSPEDIETILQNRTGGVLIEGVYPDGTKAYFGFGV